MSTTPCLARPVALDANDSNDLGLCHLLHGLQRQVVAVNAEAVDRAFGNEQRTSRRFSGGFDSGFPATRFPWINPQPTPAYLFIRKKLSAIPYTLSGVQTQHSGIFESVFVTKRLAKLAGTNKN